MSVPMTLNIPGLEQPVNYYETLASVSLFHAKENLLQLLILLP